MIKQKWYRFKLQHGLGVASRRRNSRTTSFFLTSTTEVHPLRALKNKMCPDFDRGAIASSMGQFDNGGLNNQHVSRRDYVFDNGIRQESEYSLCPCSCVCNQSEVNCQSSCYSDITEADEHDERNGPT